MLARVPWLDRPIESAPLAVAPATEPVFDATFFQPHQLLATADQPLEHLAPVPTVVRFDPPQPLAASSPAHQPPPAVTQRDQEETTAPQTIVRSAESRGSDGVTQLRFDPPVVSQPEPQPVAALHRAPEPSAWHQTVATLDNTIRQYHRFIMLAALLTAAGLMMLVLESQQTEVEPAGETVTPAAIDTLAMQPMPMAEASSEPAEEPPQQVAMAKGPQAISREACSEPEEAACETSPAPLLEAQQRDITILPRIDAPMESLDEGGYQSTGLPAFQLATPTPSSASQPRARLSKDLKPANPQTR